MIIFDVFFYIFFTLTIVSVSALIACHIGKEILIAVYSALVVTAAILAQKVVSFGIFVVPSAIIVASTTFFVADILSEIWGKKEANKAIIAGLVSLGIFIISQYISVIWVSPGFALENGKMYNAVISTSPRIVIASVLGFILSQFLDVYIYNYLKSKTKGGKLWLRNNASTITSEIIDTLIFIPFAYLGTYPFSSVMRMIIGMVCVKIIITFLNTPFLYFIVWYQRNLRKEEMYI